MPRYEIWVDGRPEMTGPYEQLVELIERLNTPRARLVLVERTESVHILAAMAAETSLEVMASGA